MVTWVPGNRIENIKEQSLNHFAVACADKLVITNECQTSLYVTLLQQYNMGIGYIYILINIHESERSTTGNEVHKIQGSGEGNQVIRGCN